MSAEVIQRKVLLLLLDLHKKVFPLTTEAEKIDEIHYLNQSNTFKKIKKFVVNQFERNPHNHSIKNNYHLTFDLKKVPRTFPDLLDCLNNYDFSSCKELATTNCFAKFFRDATPTELRTKLREEVESKMIKLGYIYDTSNSEKLSDNIRYNI